MILLFSRIFSQCWPNVFEMWEVVLTNAFGFGCGQMPIPEGASSAEGGWRASLVSTDE